MLAEVNPSGAWCGLSPVFDAGLFEYRIWGMDMPATFVNIRLHISEYPNFYFYVKRRSVSGRGWLMRF